MMEESYESILSRMQNKFKDLSGFEADDASDIGIRMKVLAGEIFSAYSNIEWLKNQVFPQTAIGKQLDYHAQQRGIERKPALKAKGILKFSISSALTYNVNIVSGTICSTAQTEGVRYVTTNDAVLEAGKTSVEVSAEAEEGGSIGNCVADSITTMVTPPTGITTVTNEAAFTGGADEENDESLRFRVLDSYKNISNGTNAAFYKEQVLKNENIISAQVVSKNRGAGTVDVYIWTSSGIPSDDLIAEVQAELDSIKEINVDIKVLSPTTVKCDVFFTLWIEDGYVYDDVKFACVDAVKNYINSLAVGESMILAKAGNAVFNVPGVKNYRMLTSYCDDVTISAGKIGIPGSIAVSQGS